MIDKQLEEAICILDRDFGYSPSQKAALQTLISRAKPVKRWKREELEDLVFLRDATRMGAIYVVRALDDLISAGVILEEK